MKTKALVFLVSLLLAALPARSVAQVTAFTYQGYLTDDGGGANGTYDFEFSLFDVDSGGVALDGPLAVNGVPVSNGLFVVTIDFGSKWFDGTQLWLELGVKTNGGGGFTTLSPRSQITATPYAIFAATAPVAPNSVDSTHIINGQVANADLANNSVTSAKITDGTITSADIADGGVSRLDLNADARYSLDAQGGLPTDVVLVNNIGLVGIGNPTPTYQLDVNSGGLASVLRLASDNDPLQVFFEGATYRAFLQAFGNDFYLANRSAGRTIFRTSNLDRMAIDSAGNVGIGTTAPDPDSRLHLVLPNSVSIPSFRIESLLTNNGFGMTLENPNETWRVGLNIGNWDDGRFNILSSSGLRGLIIAPNGNVGIDSVSAASPFATLTVDGSIGFPTVATPAMYVYPSGTSNADKPLIMHSPSFPGYGLYYRDVSDQFVMRSSATDTTPSLVVDLDSNWVTIGTDTPKPGYELSVNGQIVCEELLVEDMVDWPDYVFEENYPLKSLSEVESHIKERKHLPGIPTATEVKRDGLPVGEMQKRMMEKIEELTLYVIDQNKRLAAQEQRILELQSQIQERQP